MQKKAMTLSCDRQTYASRAIPGIIKIFRQRNSFYSRCQYAQSAIAYWKRICLRLPQVIPIRNSQ
ncbi:hypothetical protein [Nostoc sp. NMS4]|uniref:hypothetical protein n=1 Tax=Nostoc sp. NMS4 TaxID=2815390 RepID=UPI0025F31D50|nr:hypothetical protein [Nostoc sp. NMS4]MBN3922061.1 hypothetical protein [Nostoc sp. NMS4]